MHNRALLVVFVAFQLSGCAAAPTFRNAVFLVDKSAPLQVLEPKGFLPPPKSPFYLQAAYRYPPGSVIIPSINESPNPISESAGLIGEAREQCMQESFALRRSVLRSRLAPVKLVYSFGGAVGLPFADQIALQQFRNQGGLTELPDNVIAYIRHVEFNIDRIRTYEGSPEQMAAALRSLRTVARTCDPIESPNSAVVIQKVYVGRVRSFVRLDDAIGVALGGNWKDKVQKSIRSSFDGRSVIFAVETKPLSAYRL
ncbi:hypothetical protein HMPREF9696_03641 [Afipia clevelandensis ATCC 49720]|uniref:Uncharacterized protein n=1 Tax=Afipia clevelandensis ATCC 49720 TaxID=883079 RepID=K8NVZ6_9BRAD|nr:hypothetical protein HMPREF9696_03641 [Afipia clevelandensis ATCC 49720]